ncbi:nitrate- and nitrite sensing domain-containing protein [Actinacidiphila glaucinigra]|uniref:sensor histidine kinase n=1 Tax=Actinacidiphila glaucinigra TaxID=235986 RepID=UPI002E309351|nr:nitrate- and nitrite sensing domain-containing protein [Actinacidiphila glaucinigra]
MRNWRVATRLNVILLIPVLVALVFGGFRVQSSVKTWQDADDAVRTANAVRAAVDYANAILNERDLSVVPLLAGDADNKTVVATRAATDQAAAKFDAAVTELPVNERLQRRVANIREGEKVLAKLRDTAFTRQLPGVQTEEKYVEVQHPLMELANELGFGTNSVASYGRTLYALELSKAAESLTRSIGTHLLVEDRSKLADGELRLQLTAFTSYAYLQQVALEEYRGGGTDADYQRLQSEQAAALQKGKEQVAQAAEAAKQAGQPFKAPPSLENMIKLIASGQDPEQLKSQGVTAESWFGASTLAFDAYKNVEQHLANQAYNDSSDIADSARIDAIVNSAVVLIALIIAFIVAAMVARSMSNSMRRLRTSAFEVAEQRLPSLVDQLSRTDPGKVDTRVQAIPITSNDEIGEVARAFDQIHREAVRLAAEQALLRGNVNAIFTNLSRRNQGLIQRQLTLITDLENNEAEPDQLENLFKLDHLATRMRRNGENLLVLAGEEPGRRWNQPVPLVDVLRAAASEVEAYARIELVGIPETEIHGTAVTDLVHLLAELLENATTFSSPQTKVRVTATRLPDGRVMVEIHDKGIGLTAEDFADINHKLADPPIVDASISKRMGLFVVGRLADRHGIRVQLRPSGEQAGTTSLVMLPEPITHGGGGEETPLDDDFTVSRIVPELETPQFDAYGPTAAELGFDDSRYERVEVPNDARSLDPVGRSLMRDQRRAQLEAAAGDRTGERPPFEGEAQEQGSFQDGYQEAGAEAAFQETPFQDNGFPANGYAEQGYQEPQAQPFPEQHGYDAQTGFQEPAYTEGAYAEQGYAAPQNGYAQDGWQQQNGYAQEQWTPAPGGELPQAAPQQGFPAQAATDSAAAAPFGAPERVGFDQSGPTTGPLQSSVTDAGLPRRDRGWQQSGPAAPAQPEPQSADAFPAQSAPSAPAPDGESSSDWRSTNDENWQRAEQARKPKAGGVTPSGLPRRVPKANLVPGTAQQTPQGGPMVSRAPEDVRGRLSNLRRGVQQGRTAGTDTNGQGFGPKHQER